MSESSASRRRVRRRRRFPESERLGSFESSEGSPALSGGKGSRRKRIICSSSESDSDVIAPRRRRKHSSSRPVIISDSDDDRESPEELNICPICLGSLDEANLRGRPECCMHTFCVDCIVAWSKNNTSCALCRKAFAKINVLLRDEFLEELPVQRVDPEAVQEDPISNIFCLRCLRYDDEDTLLLCDNCNDAYHCACLSPPLMRVPSGHWFCPRCGANRHT